MGTGTNQQSLEKQMIPTVTEVVVTLTFNNLHEHGEDPDDVACDIVRIALDKLRPSAMMVESQTFEVSQRA